MTGQPRLRIDEIAFTSKDRETSAGLDLSAPFSFIYGASNTGKSFAVKAIDFMLGGNRELPDINERKPFQRIAMAMRVDDRSEEHTSELQSLMRISYAVFCLKKKNNTPSHQYSLHTKVTQSIPATTNARQTATI